jgi:hypothetical protein
MNSFTASPADLPDDVLNAPPSAHADTAESGKKAFEVVRSRSPELTRISEQTGDDLLDLGQVHRRSAHSLRSDVELLWSDIEQRIGGGAPQSGAGGCRSNR